MMRMGVVCEAAFDFAVVRAIVESIVGSADTVSYCAADAADTYIKWSSVPELARRAGIRAHGSQDKELDARLARLALLLINSFSSIPSAVVLLRDSDGYEERLRGLSHASSDLYRFSVTVGLAHPKIECWILSVWQHRSPQEQDHLESIKAEIGLHPCARAHELTGSRANPLREPKRVLEKLLGDDPAFHVEVIRSWNGESYYPSINQTGLAAFRQQLEGILTA